MSGTNELRDEIRQTTPFRSRAQEATVAVLRTADVLRQRLTAVIEPHGLTFQQYNVLRILRGSHPDPLPTLEIRERLIERTPGITRHLDRLERKGLVRRERSAEDRRVVNCWITDAGLELLAGMDAAVDEADEASMAALDDETLEALLEGLRIIRRAGD